MLHESEMLIARDINKHMLSVEMLCILGSGTKFVMASLRIVTLAGSRLYTSLADTPEIIDEALNRFEEVFKHVSKTDKGLVK